MRGIDYLRQTRRTENAIRSRALGDKLRHCRKNICQCISEFLSEQDGGGNGLNARFERMMGPNAVKSGRPTHIEQIRGRQRNMQEAMDIYDQHCRGPNAPEHATLPQRALDNIGRPIPTVEDWEEAHGRPQPEGQYIPGQKNNFDATEYADEAAVGITAAGVVYFLWQLARVYPPRNAIPF